MSDFDIYPFPDPPGFFIDTTKEKYTKYRYYAVFATEHSIYSRAYQYATEAPEGADNLVYIDELPELMTCEEAVDYLDRDTVLPDIEIRQTEPNMMWLYMCYRDDNKMPLCTIKHTATAIEVHEVMAGDPEHFGEHTLVESVPHQNIESDLIPRIEEYTGKEWGVRYLPQQDLLDKIERKFHARN